MDTAILGQSLLLYPLAHMGWTSWQVDSGAVPQVCWWELPHGGEGLLARTQPWSPFGSSGGVFSSGEGVKPMQVTALTAQPTQSWTAKFHNTLHNCSFNRHCLDYV